jgi:hypothetical protein
MVIQSALILQDICIYLFVCMICRATSFFGGSTDEGDGVGGVEASPKKKFTMFTSISDISDFIVQYTPFSPDDDGIGAAVNLIECNRYNQETVQNPMGKEIYLIGNRHTCTSIHSYVHVNCMYVYMYIHTSVHMMIHSCIFICICIYLIELYRNRYASIYICTHNYF